MRDRRDTRERLASKSECRDAFEVFRPPNLARSVTLDREPGIFWPHPLTVVFDVNSLLAADLDGNGDAPRAGVDRVLDQLLDHRGRTLDDLTGGNLIREIAWKDLDPLHAHSPYWLAADRCAPGGTS